MWARFKYDHNFFTIYPLVILLLARSACFFLSGLRTKRSKPDKCQGTKTVTETYYNHLEVCFCDCETA